MDLERSFGRFHYVLLKKLNGGQIKYRAYRTNHSTGKCPGPKRGVWGRSPHLKRGCGGRAPTLEIPSNSKNKSESTRKTSIHKRVKTCQCYYIPLQISRFLIL
eukprot:sb/3478208/